MVLGEGHKFLLAAVQDSTVIYLSSIPGISSDMYSQFTEDNFYYEIPSFVESSSTNNGNIFSENWSVYYKSDLTAPTISYDSSTGKVTLSPALLNGSAKCYSITATANKKIETKFYFIK